MTPVRFNKCCLRANLAKRINNRERNQPPLQSCKVLISRKISDSIGLRSEIAQTGADETALLRNSEMKCQPSAIITEAEKGGLDLQAETRKHVCSRSPPPLQCQCQSFHFCMLNFPFQLEANVHRKRQSEDCNVPRALRARRARAVNNGAPPSPPSPAAPLWVFCSTSCRDVRYISAHVISPALSHTHS